MRKLGVSAGAAVLMAIASPGVGHAAGTTPDVAATLASAVQVVNGYWSAHYSDFFNGTYAPPKVIGPGQASGGTPCGAADPNDAFYCGNTINVGGQFLGNAAEFGDLFVYQVLAHEWGHAIQDRAVGNLNELGADCLSGAALGASYKAGNKALEGGTGDLVKKAFDRGGDSRPASRPDDHGTGQQRFDSYMKGWNEGPTACVDSKYVKADAPKQTTPTPDPTPTPEATVPPETVPPVTVPPAPDPKPSLEQTAGTDPATTSPDPLGSLGSLS